MKGMEVCRFHGGLSRGPTSIDGKKKCAIAKTVHGTESRKNRAELRAGIAYIAVLEALGRSIGMFAGPNTRGRR